MGTPGFAVPPLDQLALNGYEIAAVYTQPDTTSGRGRHQESSPVKLAALELGLHVEQPAKLKEPNVMEQLSTFQPDVIVVAAYGQILPPPVLALARRGCVNVHPSLLPKFRGASPVPATILAGDSFAGVSIMLLDAGIDNGPVLAQCQVAVSHHDTTGSLTEKLSRVGAQMLLETLPRWVGGGITPRTQDEALATYSGMLAKEEGAIDWGRPALETWRRVRAFQPWPGCFTEWREKQLKIIEAEPLQGLENIKQGQVVKLDNGGFGVGTGQGTLGVIKVQLEGKKAMSSAEFLRGQPALIGSELPSRR